jgi:hypothetical protein
MKDASAAPSAFLLQSGEISKQGGRVERVLDFFGVSSRAGSAREITSGNGLFSGSCKTRLLCSAKELLQIIHDLENGLGDNDRWTNNVHSVFVYSGDDLNALQELAKSLVPEAEVTVLRPADAERAECRVSTKFDDFCGVMAGINVARFVFNADVYLVSNTKGNSIPIISSGAGVLFLKVEYRGVPIFLSTFKDIIDLGAELTSQNFDIREHFLSATPLVLYIKWAFRSTCWSASEANACLIIDDPLLRRKYGCVEFERLLASMQVHRFSTSVAFIPWNWRRSSPEIVSLFKKNPEHFSLSVHGCDHVSGEFGASDRPRLYGTARRALERMSRHARDTGLQHDCVMVFPQGVFSKAGMDALKHTNFIGAVNNDVVSTDGGQPALMIADLWEPAVMRYSSFPIFTRRYPWEGVENFAFDILLGKPALIVIHHDYFSDGYDRLITFVEALNGLNCSLRWNNLGNVVRRSFRRKPLSSDTSEIQMYGKELRLENHSDHRMRYLVRKLESNPSDIKEVRFGTGTIAYECHEDCIRFTVELNGAESALIRVIMHELDEKPFQSDENLAYRVKAMLRRYMCELRDNHITPTRLRLIGSR